MPGTPSLSTLHLSTAKSWRGGENQLLLLAEGLQERGHKVLIAAPKTAPLLDKAKAQNMPVRALTIRGELDPAGMYRLSKLLREIKPDILHLHDAHAVLAGQIAARTRPANSLAVIAHRRTAFRIRSKWKYGGRINRIIAISQSAKEQVLKAGLPAEKVDVVYSGLLFKESTPSIQQAATTLRDRLGIRASAVLLGHAAALTSEKRQCDLVKAVKSCMKRTSNSSADAECEVLKGQEAQDVHLAIAGKGPLEGELRQQVHALGLKDRVHFLGFVRDLAPLWEASDLAVFSSELEGLCTALVEAQGAGVPAVVTRAGGMEEVVQEDETGKLVPVGAIDELSDAIMTLLQNRTMMDAMGKAARKRARSLFSAEAMLQGTLDVYANLMRP